MKKPQSLLDMLQSSIPQLKIQPDQISMLVRSGTIVCGGASSLSHEYAYTVQIVLLDWTGELAAIVVPLLAWLRIHQPDLALNPASREKAIRFETQYTSRTSLDLYIEVDLVERVFVVRRDPVPGVKDPSGVFERWSVDHQADEVTSHDLLGIPAHWKLIDQDDNVIAEFDFDEERV